MSRKQSSKGLGYSSNNETAKELTRLSFKKQLNTIEVCDVWREYEQKIPDLKKKLSFVEFKRIYNRKGKRGIDRVLAATELS